MKDIKKESPQNFVFEKSNYRLMLIGIAFLILGYILMIGGGSDDPNVFSEEIFSFTRITLSPILLLTGFVIQLFAIMKKTKHDNNNNTENKQ